MSSESFLPGHPDFDRIVVVPGFGATPDDHWFPWLSRSLPSVEVLRLPDPSTPQAGRWIHHVTSALGLPGPRTAVVTHSLGGLTTLRALQSLGPRGGRLGALVAVAPFPETLPTTGDPDLDAFITRGLPAFLSGLDVPTAAARVAAVRVLRSDDDPVVPAAASDRFARATEASVTVVPGAGHFLADEGVERLDAVIEALRDAA